MEDRLQVLQTDLTVFIRVDDLEGLADLRSLDQGSAVEASGDKVLEVNLAIPIDVALFDNAVPVDVVLRSVLLTKFAFCDSPNVLMTQRAVFVGVKPNKLLLQVLHLFLADTKTTEQREDDLLELIEAPVLNQVLLDAARKLVLLGVKLFLAHFVKIVGDPRLRE